MVWTTWSLVVSTTETVSSLVLATYSTAPLAYIAVGCRPTLIVPTSLPAAAGSMTLSVPLVEVPRVGSAGTAVP